MCPPPLSHTGQRPVVKLLVNVMERSFAIEQTYYCLYVCLHLLYLCVAAQWVWLWNSI
jgi:hypothetical protein